MEQRSMNRYASAADLGIMLGSPPAPAARVTLANWHVPPWNRWGYLHTREILPTVGIARGSGPVWTFPRGTRLDLEPVHDFLAHSWTDALVVVSRGELVGEEYRNGMHEETRHLSMSVGKSITSLVVGALAGRHLIGHRALITGYIPELLGSACTGATVQHALDMQVAGGWEVVYPKDANEFSSLEAACGWIPAPPGWSTT